MRPPGWIAGLLCAGLALQPGVAAAGGPPQRIMTTNLCADLLVLQLVPKARIASVTYLAKSGAQALFPGAETGLPVNRGTAEDILNLRPDLIVADDFSTPMTRRMTKRVGARLFELKSTATFADVRDNVRRLGAAVGEPARAEALVARMDSELTQLAATAPARPVPVVAWSGGATVPGRDTLADAVFTAAGARNIAARPGLADATYGVEDLLAARPAALLYEAPRPGVRSLTTDAGAHRVIRRLYAGRRIGYSGVATACGLPQSADTAVGLRRALRTLPEGAP